MNEARKEIEKFKSSNHSPRVGTEIANLEIQLPENYGSMDILLKNKTYEQALDRAIAKQLNVELTDVETWPDERNKLQANEWVKRFPDK